MIFGVIKIAREAGYRIGVVALPIAVAVASARHLGLLFGQTETEGLVDPRETLRKQNGNLWGQRVDVVCGFQEQQKSCRLIRKIVDVVVYFKIIQAASECFFAP